MKSTTSRNIRDMEAGSHKMSIFKCEVQLNMMVYYKNVVYSSVDFVLKRF